MTEHLIKLRGGWLSSPANEQADAGPYITLPINPPINLVPPLRLIRRFGTPHHSASLDRLLLRLRGISGVSSIWLNGREIARLTDNESDIEIELVGPLPSRNELVLFVDSFTIPPQKEDGFGWGSVALVIAPRHQSPEPEIEAV